MAESIARIFHKVASHHMNQDQKTWFQNAAAFAADTYNPNTFFNAFSAARRLLGAAPVEVSEDLVEMLKQAGAPFAPKCWALYDVGRAAMILHAVDTLPEEKHLRLLLEIYYKGDNQEKQVTLRTLSFLPAAHRFVQVGVEACRSHVQTVFETIACHNPYPAAHFDDMQFNQMVLKALFTGAPIEQILGWQERCNGELVRMASDFADERKAAGREVPVDIQKIIDYARSRK